MHEEPSGGFRHLTPELEATMHLIQYYDRLLEISSIVWSASRDVRRRSSPHLYRSPRKSRRAPSVFVQQDDRSKEEEKRQRRR